MHWALVLRSNQLEEFQKLYEDGNEKLPEDMNEMRVTLMNVQIPKARSLVSTTEVNEIKVEVAENNDEANIDSHVDQVDPIEMGDINLELGETNKIDKNRLKAGNPDASENPD